MIAKYAVLLMMCLLAAAAFAEEELQTNDINRLMLEELRGIRLSIDGLAEELKAQRKQTTRKAAAARIPRDYSSFHRQGPDMEALQEIQLADNPTPEEISDYIREIISASRGQTTFSDRDPQVAMLAEVGQENMSLLIESLSDAMSMNDYHILRAIVILADDDTKSLILETLPIHHDLVSAITQQGWEADARDILLTELKNPGQYLPLEWIQAVANLKDPESYPLLRDYFIEGRNRAWTYKAIKHLPIEDMPGAVEKAWQNSKVDEDGNRVSMAIAALEYGHLDALSFLVDTLTTGASDDYWSVQQARPAVMQFTDFRGSNEDMEPWFQENREKLQFNPSTKKFVVENEADRPAAAL